VHRILNPYDGPAADRRDEKGVEPADAGGVAWADGAISKISPSISSARAGLRSADGRAIFELGGAPRP